MLPHFEFCIIVFLLSLLALECFATTHWRVTQGGNIQSQCDSAFRLTQPHDLLSFLNQEKLSQGANKFYHSTLSKNAILDGQWIDFNTIVNVDQRLYSSKDDSPLIGQTFLDINSCTTVVTNSSL